MKQHMINGLAVARFLEKSPKVVKVVHPGKYGNTCTNVQPPNNNDPKCRQNAVFIWNGLYEVFWIHVKKLPFQNPWLLL